MIYNLVKKKLVVRLEDTRDDVGLHPARVLGPRVSKLLAISLVDLQTPGGRHEEMCRSKVKASYLSTSMRVVTTGR